MSDHAITTYILQWRHIIVTVCQITSNSTNCSAVRSGEQLRKHENSVLLTLCERNTPVPLDSPHKGSCNKAESVFIYRGVTIHCFSPFEPGDCITTVIWRWRKPHVSWQCSFQRKAALPLDNWLMTAWDRNVNRGSRTVNLYVIIQNKSTHNASTLNMRKPSYLSLTRSILWLLMPWLLTSPWHHQPWYWLCRICSSWSYLRKNFKYLCQIIVE